MRIARGHEGANGASGLIGSHALLNEGHSPVIDYRSTRHQVARGARPDAVSGTNWYLIKNARELRLTYQIRLLTFLAADRGKGLIIRIPHASRLSRDLRRFANENKATLKVERVR